MSALARLREHHRGSFHQRAMSGDWGGMQCPSACGHKDPLSLLPRQPSLDWRAEGPHSGRFVSFLLKYGETGARPDNGDDLQSAGPQGCLLGWHQPESSAPLGQGAACPGLHSGHPDLPAAKGRGCAGNFRTPPTPALLSWGAASTGLFLGLFIPGSSLPGFLSPNLCQVPPTAALTFSPGQRPALGGRQAEVGSTWRPRAGDGETLGEHRGRRGRLRSWWNNLRRCLQEAGFQAGECWRVRGRDGDTGTGEQNREREKDQGSEGESQGKFK